MTPQDTPDIERAAACVKLNHQAYEVQYLPTAIKFRISKCKGKYFALQVREISSTEYYQGTGLKTEERSL